MCGSVSAVGLEERERELWPYLRERLRVPGHLMALMRGVLGDAEVGAVVAVTPEGAVNVLAILATQQMIADEIRLEPDVRERDRDARAEVRRAKIGDYDVDILLGEWPDGQPRPLAVFATPWIEQHLLLYARTLWHRRPPSSHGRPAGPGPGPGPSA
jgi:hypothetical protein